MKNLSKEIIIGLAAVLTIIIFIWLFNFLKGNNLFNSNDSYYAVYQDIAGLEESSPVEINGYKAGIVRDIRFINDGSGKLIVNIGISSGYKLPLGTVAEITPETVLGGMKIRLRMAESTGFHVDGDTIKSRVDRGIINRLGDELSPLINSADPLIAGIDSLLTAINSIFTDEFGRNILKSSEHIENVSYKLDTLIEGSADNLNSIIKGLDNFTAMLDKNTVAIDTTISNINRLTGDLSESEIKNSIDNFNKAARETAIMLEKINNGEGSAGLLVSDDSLYIMLTNNLKQLNLLLEDIKSSPGRYVNFSLFGRKK
ncbi:MAG: MlaD family protein [Bacteroidales bacterium]|nr:MlaD family protein [Bacteroidales bacterium]